MLRPMAKYDPRNVRREAPDNSTWPRDHLRRGGKGQRRLEPRQSPAPGPETVRDDDAMAEPDAVQTEAPRGEPEPESR